MASLSPFQFLPLHIVKAIINHVVGFSPLTFEAVQVHSYMYRVLLKPLIWTCSSFRAIALPLYCSRFQIELNTKKTFIERMLQLIWKTRWSTDYVTYGYLGHPTHHLAKDLTIVVNEQAIYSGKALKVLLHTPYSGCAFPLARLITFTFVSGENSKVKTVDRLVAEANISAFVQRIRNMAPLLSEVRVQPIYNGHGSEVVSGYFGDLVSQLFQLVNRIAFHTHRNAEVPLQLKLDNICNLVHIGYSGEGFGEQLLQLTRLNAQTLQSLDIAYSRGMYVLGLVVDANGGCVTYPCLRKLKLSRALSVFTLPREVAFNGAAPFPNLRHLSLLPGNLFDDDTFFWGNSATLESLKIQLTRSTVTMFRRRGVFTPSSHPKLKCVEIDGLGSLVPIPFPTFADCVRYILGVDAVAGERDIDMVMPRALILSPSSLHWNHSSIRTLSLPRTCLTLWSTLALIKSLSALSNLRTRSLRLGSMPNGITHAELPAYICSNHAPIGLEFRCWYSLSNWIENRSEAVWCVLLMALACPNFTSATARTGCLPPFAQLMRKAIELDEFKEYAPRLQCLLK
ncbi:hypothetical protein GGI16_000995 [Coemansia sp. S142-1]|nr:hypothetical protein GGI16_000995 [Coemansia sp. S142-1]